MPPRSSSNQFDDKQKVFAKMPGYPWWPAFITPEEYVPKHVQRAQKKSTPYCVIFIPDGDFYWCTEKGLKEYKLENTSKDLSKLDAKTIAKLKDVKYLKRRLTTIPKKPATFPEAITASEKLDFDDFITIFQEDFEDDDGEEEEEEKEEEEEEEAQVDDDIAEEGEEEEEKPTVSVKKSAPLKSRNRSEAKPRRSSRTQNVDIDVDAVDDEGEDGDVEDQYQEEIPKNKRKRGSVVQASTNGKKRTLTDAAVTDKVDSEPNKKPKMENSSDEDTANAAGAAAASIKSGKAPVNDEEKQHQLYLCRIKLQRTLIQRDLNKSPPTADELLLVRLILYRLVNFPVDKELLKKTKLYKVMRYILKNPDLEYSESFKLHELCKEILEKWEPFIQQILYEKEHSNSDKSSNSSSRLLSVKNGGSGFNDDSEVSGIEQSLPEIDQSKDEESEVVEKRSGSGETKTESSVSTEKKEVPDVSLKNDGGEEKDTESKKQNGNNSHKGDDVKEEIKTDINLHENQNSQATGDKTESATESEIKESKIKTETVTDNGDGVNEDQTKELESTVDTAKAESKDDSVKTGSQSESAATKETTAPAELIAEQKSVSNDVGQATAFS